MDWEDMERQAMMDDRKKGRNRDEDDGGGGGNDCVNLGFGMQGVPMAS